MTPAGVRAGRGPSQATVLVGLATAAVELFHSPAQESFVSIQTGGHRETWPLRTRPFKTWLCRRFYDQEGGAPNSQALQDALGVLEGKALFEGFEHDVHVRVAEYEDAIYLDLADDHWQAIQITAAGWEVVANPPVRFRRAPGMLELPAPTPGGSITELRPFVNVTDDDWPLLVGWLVAALRPRGPYPVIALHGEQGAAKSSTARVLRELIDPNQLELRSHPRDERDLMIASRNAWVLAFDNLSHLPTWLSDAFCRVATGGGLATRALYSDGDEVLFEARRPLLVNGIEEIATRGDLLDRSLILYLPTIARKQRRREQDFWQAFEPVRGRLLGGLLDGVATALRRQDDVRLEQLPRMADFAHWVTAAEPAFGWPERSFLATYDANAQVAHEITLEASPIASAISSLARVGFEGTATELLARLAEYASDETMRLKSWPKSASALGGALRRLAPNLRATGVAVTFDATGSKRVVTIRFCPGSAVSAVSAVTDGLDSGLRRHTNGDSPDGSDGNDGDLRTQSADADGSDGDDGDLRTQSADPDEAEIERLARKYEAA